MKTKEEIEQLAIIDLYDRQKLGHYELADLKSRDYYYDGFINAYTQCQEDMAENKYTESQLRDAMEEAMAYSKLKQITEYINSLNKQD